MYSMEFMIVFGLFIFVLAASMHAGGFKFSGPKRVGVLIIIFLYVILFYFAYKSEKKIISFNEGNNIFCSDIEGNKVVSIRSGWTFNGSKFVKDEKSYSVMNCNMM